MKSSYYITISLLLPLLLSYCTPSTSREEAREATEQSATEGKSPDVELTDRQIEMVGITLGPIEQRRIGSSIPTTGQLQLRPQDQAEVTTLTSGVIRDIKVTEGQQVARGTIVATLENREIITLQSDYLVAVRQDELARVEWTRQEELSREGAGLLKSLQQASAGYEIAKATRQGLAAQLRQLGISPEGVERGEVTRTIALRSPISGTVSTISVSRGSYVSMETPVMRVINNSAVLAELHLFEKDLDAIAPGQRATLRVTNHPDLTITAEIYRINPSLHEQSKVVSAYARILEETCDGAIAGMSLSGVIETGARTVDALPTEAIISSAGRSFVYVEGERHEGETHFRRVEVVPGASEMGYTAVTFPEPLQEGARFVTRGAFYLESMISDHGEHSH